MATTTFDTKGNFGYSTVLTAPSPAASGTTLVVQVADAANFPDPSSANYNIVIFPADESPTASNAEIARVTAKSSNSLTITRGQESTNARNVIVGDRVIIAPTAKAFTDIETAVNTIETWKDSITSSAAELNILDGVTSTTAELNILDGVTSTATELNQLDDVTVGGTNSGDIVTIDDTQTLTNKTLTSPTINTPTLLMANNAAIQGKDSGATSRDLVKINSSDEIEIGKATEADDTIINAGTSKLVKMQGLRQDNTTDSYVTKQVSFTGWGYIAGNTGADNVSESVTFGVEFTVAPIVICAGGCKTATGSPSSIADFTGSAYKVDARIEDVTTTGFTVYLFKSDSNFGDTNNYLYTWIAIGQIT